MIYWRSCESSAFRAAALFLCPFSSTPPCRKIKGFPDVQQDGAQLRQGSVRRTCTHYRFALANARSNPALGKANGAFCGRPWGASRKMWSESTLAPNGPRYNKTRKIPVKRHVDHWNAG
jgi:hypothetical protein